LKKKGTWYSYQLWSPGISSIWGPLEIHFCSKLWTIWPCILAYTMWARKLSSLYVNNLSNLETLFFPLWFSVHCILQKTISQPLYLLVFSSQSSLSCWLWWRQPPDSPIDFITTKSRVSSPTDSWIIG
jgi:hypothetical protein